MKECKITFLPLKKEILVPAGISVMEALDLAGAAMEAPCGRHGTCGKCLVLCHGYTGGPTATELSKIAAVRLAQGWRLACQTIINGDMAIELPDQGLGQVIKGVLMQSSIKLEIKPAIRKYHLHLKRPTLSDQRADWERLQAELPFDQARVELNILKELPHLLRNNDFKLTAVACKGQVIALEGQDTTSDSYGCAIDIGTTTVVCSLHDLNTGKQLAIASAFNPQRMYGADILSRIDFSLQGDNLGKLQKLIADQINILISEAALKAGILQENIYLLSVVGNTTMLHLFLGLLPRYIAVPPFVGTLYAGMNFKAKELGIQINKAAEVSLLPHVAGYVGADIVAGVLATGAYQSKKTSLLIDVGSNAEIVLAAQGSLYACSAAAGPAFEGANISCGMRAGTGAVDKVWTENGKLHYSVIGECSAQGLCGSGLIDIIANLLQLGLIDSTGRLLTREEAAEVAGPELAERLQENDNGNEFVLAMENDLPKVRLTQGDIRQVQLAKAAILAGIRILTKEMGISIEEIERINLAGSFGNVLNRENARTVGLLPPAISLSKVAYAGNSAHIGAQMNLLRADTGEVVKEIIRKMKYIELSDRVDFTEEFTNAMFFDAEINL